MNTASIEVLSHVSVHARPTLHQVSSLAEASTMFCAARDEHGGGVSDVPEMDVVDVAGKRIARISYNGKVWPPGEWREGVCPLFNPYA